MQKNVLEYLEETARRLPDKTAFADGKGRLTFRELLDCAQRGGTALARRLQGRNRPVAVLTGRSVGPLAGFFSVLYSGNFYVPVDSSMPLARMALQLEKLDPAALVFPEPAPALWEAFSGRWPCFALEELAAAPAEEELLGQVRGQMLDTDPVYLIFTSGSTGVPKGIVLSHRSVIDFADWYVPAVGITQEDVLGNQAPFFFDLSVKDIYTTLKTGATTHILEKRCFSMPVLLTRALEEKGVTTLSWATSAFHLVACSGVLEKHPPRCVNKITAGGEAMLASDLNRWRRALPKAEITNLYGPTEVTVDCAWYPVDRDFADGEPVPIGRPCNNKEILLLDETLRPVAPGQVGEICVRGTGLAHGYYNDPEKTAAAFVQNPLNPHYPETVYRTGDLGYWGEDGLLYFSNRRDGQVKHMGYRIELGEVETALNSLPQVEMAVCFFDEAKDKLVCVYQGVGEGGQLAAALRDRLPRYMLPNLYFQKESLPHTANGKVDRAALRREYDAGG